MKTKVHFLVFFVLFGIFNLFTFSVFAQFKEDDDKTFYGGIVAGANFTQVDGDNFAGYHKAGINAGVIVYSKLMEHVAVSMELLYSMKGSNATRNQLPTLAHDQSTSINQFKIVLHYAEIPILINYFDYKSSNFGAGFSYGQLFANKEIFNNVEQQTLYPYKKFDVNFILNGNLHLYKGLTINPRFAYSILNVRKKPNTLSGRDQQFNNIWCIRLMYLF